MDHAPDNVEVASALGFDATVARLVSTIEGAGMQVLARIDHAAAAHQVGLHLRPTIVLLYGNPLKGTPVMVAQAQAALELPLRVLIYEEEGSGETRMCFHRIAPVLEAAGVDPKVADSLSPAQQLVVNAIQIPRPLET